MSSTRATTRKTPVKMSRFERFARVSAIGTLAVLAVIGSVRARHPAPVIALGAALLVNRATVRALSGKS